MDSNYLLTLSGTIAAAWIMTAFLGRLIPWCKERQELTCVLVAIPLYLVGHLSNFYGWIANAVPVINNIIVLIASILGIAVGAGIAHDKVVKPITEAVKKEPEK